MQIFLLSINPSLGWRIKNSFNRKNILLNILKVVQQSYIKWKRNILYEKMESIKLELNFTFVFFRHQILDSLTVMLMWCGRKHRHLMGCIMLVGWGWTLITQRRPWLFMGTWDWQVTYYNPRTKGSRMTLKR